MCYFSLFPPSEAHILEYNDVYKWTKKMTLVFKNFVVEIANFKWHLKDYLNKYQAVIIYWFLVLG